MSDWLKSFGQGLGGLGLLIVSLAYWARVQEEMRANTRDRTGELVGLLTSVAAEISVNERTLDRLVEEPHRLVAPAERVIETGYWDRNGLRVARAIGNYGAFSPIAQYYEYAQRLRESVGQGATTRKGVEELTWNAQACRQQGAFVQGHIFRYLSSMMSTELAK